jgi:hypothetical protein
MKVQITLKSGAQIKFRAKEVTTSHDSAGAVVGFQWVSPGRDSLRLHTVEVNDIAAIVLKGRST